MSAAPSGVPHTTTRAGARRERAERPLMRAAQSPIIRLRHTAALFVEGNQCEPAFAPLSSSRRSSLRRSWPPPRAPACTASKIREETVARRSSSCSGSGGSSSGHRFRARAHPDYTAATYERSARKLTALGRACAASIPLRVAGRAAGGLPPRPCGDERARLLHSRFEAWTRDPAFYQVRLTSSRVTRSAHEGHDAPRGRSSSGCTSFPVEHGRREGRLACGAARHSAAARARSRQPHR